MHSRKLNRLNRETSPYLLQHAHNPVDWYPWGEEAFDRARQEDRPIFLSIGYSTCHWCHVMARESFEDPTAASLLNEAFICVKVDREERPDIDRIYMDVCQRLTGGGGWPLTIVMTPEGLPFFAATYLPKEGRWGRDGLVEIIPRITNLWERRRGDVEKAARQTVALLRQSHRLGPEELDAADLAARAFAELRGQFDEENGGFGSAPKFPMPHQIVFLLRYWRRTGAPQALRMAVQTLSAMRRGGIFDQVGFGFHRYSTDRQWLVPHFEKMLYDQALLAMAFTEAYQATGDEYHARAVREIFDYGLRDLQAPEGAFFTAEDADSEGLEGRFYLWRMGELRGLLTPEELRLATAVFSLADGGNFTDPVEPVGGGDNIFHLGGPQAEIAASLGMTEAAFQQGLESLRLRLLTARAKRIRPQRDDKILTDWNGLMIAALARASRILGEPRYLTAARRAIAFLLARLKTAEGRLLHRYCRGEAAVAAGLDDYAFLIWGLIETYEAGFKCEDLRSALDLQEIVDRHFRDSDGGFFSTPDDGETLLFRPKEGYDGAVPSGNAVSLMNLVRLGRMTGNPRREEDAAALGRAFARSLARIPSAHAQWMAALELLAAPSLEVVVAGDPEAKETKALLAVLNRSYLPGLTVLLRGEKEGEAMAAIAPFTRDLVTPDGRTAAYVCTGFACRPPVTDPEALQALLEAGEKKGSAVHRSAPREG